MLIVLGGLQGSGRRQLAKEAAKRLGYHYYNISEKKFRRRAFTKAGVREWIPKLNSDEERTLLYRRVIRDFPMLSKMYTDVVVDDVFHRTVPREEFLLKARQYFKGVLFVWVELKDELAEARLNLKGMRRKERIMQRRASARKEFQTLNASVAIFSLLGTSTHDQELFHEFLQKEVAAIQ